MFDSVMSQSLTWLCTCLAIGLYERWRWMTLRRRCRRIHARHPVDIPEDNPLDEDPLNVFDDCNVQDNVFRFVAYILWLRRQPESFESYLEVKRQRPCLWQSCETKLLSL